MHFLYTFCVRFLRFKAKATAGYHIRGLKCHRLLRQSRTQSPQAFWSAGGRQERLENSKKFNFFDWLSRNSLHCFTAEILR